MQSVKFMYSKFRYDEKPEDFDKRTQQFFQYVSTRSTIPQIAAAISDGRCWRNGTYKEGARRFLKDEVIGSHFIALDFDKVEYDMDEVIEFAKEKNMIPNIAYYSFSEGVKAGHNFRIVWVLEDDLEAEKWSQIYKKVLKIFKDYGPDLAVKNSSRMWYGSNKKAIVLNEEPTALSIMPKASRTIVRQTKNKEPQIDYDEVSFHDNWEEDLKKTCKLWRDFTNGKYLNRNQRFLLAGNMKAGGYGVMKRMLEIGNELGIYEDHTFGYDELKNWWDDDTVGAYRRIVRWGGESYTVAEYFSVKMF